MNRWSFEGLDIELREEVEGERTEHGKGWKGGSLHLGLQQLV